MDRLAASPYTHETDDPFAGDCEPIVLPVPLAAPASAPRGWHLRVRAKFMLACIFAMAWTAFSVWLSLPWLRELAGHTHWAFAVIAITFIAYVPGFMNAFLLSTLTLDRQPA